jgi:hypothetical protein
LSFDESTNKEEFDSKIKSAPMLINNLSVVDISLSCGVLLSVIGLSAKIEANKMGNEEFLEPEALMVPFRGLPPWITNLYIYKVALIFCKFFCQFFS